MKNYTNHFSFVEIAENCIDLNIEISFLSYTTQYYIILHWYLLKLLIELHPHDRLKKVPRPYYVKFSQIINRLKPNYTIIQLFSNETFPL